MTLPTGWAEATLGELGTWQGGGTPSKANAAYWINGTIPWVSPKDMKRSHIDSAEDYITKAAVQGSATNLVPAGALLLVMRSGILRHSLPAAITTGPVAINQDLKALTPAREVEAEFLLRFIAASEQALLHDCTKAGTTVDSVDFERLKAFAVPLPPLAEQRRIVATLDALTARLTRARAELDRVPTLAARMKAVVLTAMVGAHEKGNRSELRNHLASVRTGPFGSSVHKSDYVEGGTPLINPMHIQGGKIVPSPTVTVADSKARELREFAMQSGDVIIGRRGEMGRCAVVREAQDGYLIGTGSMALRPSQELSSEYLQLYLSSPEVIAALEHAAVGSTMVNLNQKILLGLPISVPDLGEQARHVDQVQQAFAHADRLEAEATRARALLDRLESALLEKAFRGELVPQDPNDEPAQTLLDRIRTQRAAAPKVKRGRKIKAPA